MALLSPSSLLGRRLTGIEVEGLFDQFSYSLGSPAAVPTPADNLVILYGDNGTGKTTILRLVYHLLSKEDDRGHRGFVARTPFRRLSLTLDSHVRVIADRPNGNLVGNYRLRIYRGKEVIADADATVSEDRRIRSSEWPTDQRERWAHFIRTLSSLEVTVSYLGEDRELAERNQDRELSEVELVQREWLTASRLINERKDQRSRDPVVGAVGQFETWVREQVIRGSTIGEANINTLYTDVARRIAHTGLRTSGEDRDSSALLQEMTRIEDESQPFADIGLLARPRLSELRGILEGAHHMTQSIIASVMRPYVDSLSARLDALRPIHNVLRAFLDNANAFLTNKTLSFNLSSGVQVATKTGDILSPSMLSSGERQLLLLFCTTVSARTGATISIIDEPEISLNVKWQRLLVDALLDLVQGAPVQFLLATHSVELLTQHSDRVWQLKPTDPQI